MCAFPAEAYDWKPLSLEVPSEIDFDPYNGDLDAQFAWREFGGLSLHEAYEHFLDCPENRQEDFMFMGSRAFLFYFPVIERYLYSVQASHELDDCQAWILGHVLLSQFRRAGADLDPGLHKRLAALSSYVRGNLNQYAAVREQQVRIDAPWAELEQALI